MAEAIKEPQDGTNPEPEEVEGAEEIATAEEETEETPEEEEAEEEEEEMVPKSQFNQVLARAKKAEALNKQKVPVKKPINQPNALSEQDIDIRLLKSQGMSDELIGELKTLAKLRNKSILDVQNDPIFVAIKAEKEKEAKDKKSKLPVSRGSGTAKPTQTFNTPGISREDHKAKWNEANGR